MTATASQRAAARPSASTGNPPAVVVEGVNKTFRLPHQQFHTLKERALHPMRSRSYDELHALQDINLEVARGEFFGIVGRNGSGKSTLLKCLADIYDVDTGSIAVEGRLSPFIELGVGFNQDLTARDNVIINAIMLGLSRKEARARFDEIIEFAELEDFVDLKLKNYSSGMSVRLGFAVAVQVDADVLLVDEVLAVGDASFQQKCFDQFERMKADGRTILFVTHDMNSVERFCHRAMLIEKGRMIDIGDPGEVSSHYSEINYGERAHAGEATAASTVARIGSAWCEGRDGETIVTQQQGEHLRVHLEVEFLEAAQDPQFAVTFRNEARHTILVLRSEHDGPSGRFEAGERARITFGFDNWLASSRYALTPSVAIPGAGTVAELVDYASLIVAAPHVTGGVTEPPRTLEIQRS